MSRHSSLVIKDDKTYIKFKTICLELGEDLQDVVWQFIVKKVAEYDGKKNGIDNYFDQSFVPKPEIDANFESNILPWLRTLNDDKLHIVSINNYRSFIYIKALQDTPPDQRKDVNFDYLTIWKRYR